MVKKIVVPRLGVIMIAFFPRNIRWSSLFARKAHVNTERVPPGHPIILLKSNKFNMAAVSVKKVYLGHTLFFTDSAPTPFPSPPPLASETRMTNNLAYLTSSGFSVRVISSSFFRCSLSLNNFSKTTKAINSGNFESFLGRAHRNTP